METTQSPELSSAPSGGTTQIPGAYESPATESLFKQLESYPFLTDREFASGLSIILGHPETPATEAEISRTDDLVLQAKCFYFSKKANLSAPLDFAAYKHWLGSVTAPAPSEGAKTAETQQHQLNTSTAVEQPLTESPGQGTRHQEPSYPSSFAHIVELITTGQPIPGIQQIPDTVLTGHDTPSSKPSRQKPWEKKNADNHTQEQNTATGQ
ncbi:hypothetical protein P168DRAFT_327991 [Aspergillus campestris IBT 28561]|uniref:Uncharacterized protein n=1 Tax=Aspergillus campestris (strain IBT 28561) TaxID=1392248 RepID=A0A2I1D290_ASPC2|nr:uncharacterized protein P168DRAFT_327991 [Aspergillus campestris IBT 28561]PKY03977.1 hypothetical protein P168DRAFT_327991 [Aspergillus campestris IBT 28561]